MPQHEKISPIHFGQGASSSIQGAEFYLECVVGVTLHNRSHLAVDELNDGQTKAVIFDDDIGVSPIHGAECPKSFRWETVEDLRRHRVGRHVCFRVEIVWRSASMTVLIC